IMTVTLGIRAAHLIDFAFLTLEESKILLSSFQKLLLTKLENDLINKFKGSVFIDVSWNCKESGCREPKMINTPPSFKKFLETHVRPFFLEWSDIHSSSLTTKSSVLFVPTTPTCIVTFAGWILEYPAVYVLDSTLDSEIDIFDARTMKNCLGSQNLKLYRAFLENIDANNSNGSMCDEPPGHTLLSFSIPSNIWHNLQQENDQVGQNNDKITVILKNIFDPRIKNQTDWNLGFRVEINDICLPVVAL
ncbi:18762_t:CDS:2, partial [Racocetra persica]